MPQFRSEFSARGRARTKPVRADLEVHHFKGEVSDANFAACTRLGQAKPGANVQAPNLTCPTMSSCPPSPGFAKLSAPADLENGFGPPRPPSQFGSAGLGMTLCRLQSDVAEMFCRERGGDPTPPSFTRSSPHQSLGPRALGLALERWAAGTKQATLRREFLLACDQEEDAWRSIARAPNYPGHLARAVSRNQRLQRLRAGLCALDEQSIQKRPAKVSLIYASVLAGLNEFERAQKILQDAREGLEQTSPILALSAFLKMMGTGDAPHQAHWDAVSLCYGHLAGAPTVALMVLAVGYELRQRLDLATACYVLAATRPVSSGLDCFYLLGPGLNWLRTYRDRAHGADWMRC